MLIICILILIVLALGIIFLNKKEVKTYVDDVVMFTYDYTLNDNIEVMEIYSFNEKEECIGTNIKIIVNDDEDSKRLMNVLNNEENEIKSVIMRDNIITCSSNGYFNHSKDGILKAKKNNLNNVQNLEITDM